MTVTFVEPGLYLLFNDDLLVKKYTLKLGLLVAEQLLLAPDERAELLPDILARKKQIHLQLRGRRLQLLRASNNAKTSMPCIK